MSSTFPATRRFGQALAAVIVGLTAIAAMPGCFVGGMMRSYELTGSSWIEAEYVGLEGHTYALVVVADRFIQAERPEIVPRLTQRVDAMLYQNAGATQHIPANKVLNYQFNNPEWRAIPRGELAERLGVERLVVVELLEYRLLESGNEYVWDGRAAAVVEVYETTGGFIDLPVYERQLAVRFPDDPIFLTSEISSAGVNSELSRRISDRIAWLFYRHEESNRIPY